MIKVFRWISIAFLVCRAISLYSEPASFQSYNYPKLHIRHYNYLGEITEISSDSSRKDATFDIIPGLADPHCVSFESVNYPGWFLVDNDGRLTLMERSGNAEFDRRATFKKVPGLKDRRLWSFESYIHPGSYIRHYYFHLYVQAGNDDIFRQDATFRAVDPFYERPAMAVQENSPARSGSTSTVTPQLPPIDFATIDRKLADLRHRIGIWPPGFSEREGPGIRNEVNSLLSELSDINENRGENSDLHWRIGECYVLLSSLDEDTRYWNDARGHVNRAMQLDPESAGAWAAQGRIEILSHRRNLLIHDMTCVDCAQNAIEYYGRAVSLSLGDVRPDIHMGLAYAYYYKNDLDDCLEHAGSYLAAEQDSPSFRAFRDSVLLKHQYAAVKRSSAGETIILKPGTIESGANYPVLIFLPFTDGSASNLLDYYIDQLSEKPCYIVVPPGTGSEADYDWEGFSAAIDRYEKYIDEALSSLRRTDGRNIGKVFLAGYSLGGDLAWAISVRNPGDFDGSVLMGTRCGYPVDEEILARLENHGYRAVFTCGYQERQDRRDGMVAARERFTEAGILSRFSNVPGGHVPAEPTFFMNSLNYLFR